MDHKGVDNICCEEYVLAEMAWTWTKKNEEINEDLKPNP